MPLPFFGAAFAAKRRLAVDAMGLGKLSCITAEFAIPGELISFERFGTGHLHDTYLGVYIEHGASRRYVHQRINSNVFKNIPALMDNISRVTAHLQSKLARAKAPAGFRRSLTLVPTRKGLPYLQDATGEFWRCYECIEGTRSYDTPEDPVQAFQAGRAFGEFQRLLADLPPPRLHETIPDFHHTRNRYEALQRTAEEDPCGRLSSVEPEIAFARKREPIVDMVLRLQEEGALPERVTHNDTKLNNVLLDAQTSEAVCVIDLDTVMPGLSLHDFGDMIRSTTPNRPEDEPDFSKVEVHMPFYDALVEGYLTAARTFLNRTEVDHLAFSGKLITFEIGLRFLTDYLAGDTYFRTDRPGQNLDRCRAQFALVKSIEAQEERMREVVQETWTRLSGRA